MTLDTALYKIGLKDQSGVYVAWIVRFDSLTYEKSVNTFDTHCLILDNDDNDNVALFELDGQIEVWRKLPGESWYCDYEGFHRTGYKSILADGRRVFTSYGRGYGDLLNRRIIIGFKGTAYTEKTAVAETVFKEFVSEQCVAGAIFRVVTGLTVQADAASGNAISVQSGWANLLETLSKFAWDTGGVDFAVVGTGPATFEFRVYDGILGTDRTVGNLGGNPIAVFSDQWGTLRLPVYGIARTAEVTAFYIGGAGSLITRPLELRTDAAAIALSPWNRIEGFRDGGNATDPTILQNQGDAELIKGQAKEQFAFEMVQSNSLLYGRDFFLGDMITVRFDGIDTDKQITSIQVNVNRNGETVTPKVIDRVI